MIPAVRRLPAEPGVYRFRDAGGRVLYVGRATDLRSRVASYWGTLGDRRHLRRMVPQITRVEAVACDSVHEATWLERNLLEQAKPRWNRIRGGLEVPTCIRLEHVGGVPRLTVAYWPVADLGGTYGPYLGGARTRLAVSALDRVWPLRFTDDRLDGAHRDMAASRGVGPADRDRFVAAVTAVLRREPGAVREALDRLAAHRDRAAERLGFELAARIQQEIEAIGWISAEQKVTLLGPPPEDAEVHGWADGLLVRFRVRGGRVCGWEQRACSPAAATPYLDRTPPDWRPFASRAADLGRLLTA